MKNKLKDELLAYIKQNNKVSFAEIMNEFPDEKGNMVIQAKNLNIVYWEGVSAKLAEAVAYLKNEKLVEFSPCHVSIYVIDGAYLDMPIARKMPPYKQERWLPVTIDATTFKKSA